MTDRISSGASWPAYKFGHLTQAEAGAILNNLDGLACLITFHEAQRKQALETGTGPGAQFHANRVRDLQAIGQRLIDANPDAWTPEQVAKFTPASLAQTN
ncbi:hypothetical protein [Comamonas thiooxydans]|uniref:hypothetical protein n=1 Tax=Comamonas thiooxydans TaxID=363952 RepID=UPI000B41EEBE|nr:hypothetical protein [Comamonas thiooxydans]